MDEQERADVVRHIALIRDIAQRYATLADFYERLIEAWDRGEDVAHLLPVEGETEH